MKGNLPFMVPLTPLVEFYFLTVRNQTGFLVEKVIETEKVRREIIVNQFVFILILHSQLYFYIFFIHFLLNRDLLFIQQFMSNYCNAYKCRKWLLNLGIRRNELTVNESKMAFIRVGTIFLIFSHLFQLRLFKLQMF